jgi:hypothetical protein
MTTLVLPKGSLVTLGGIELSEHNRQPFDITNDEIKSDSRTVNGLMRRYYISSKRRFTLRWDFLPALDGKTVDGKAGRNSLKSLYATFMETTIAFTYKEVDASNNQTSVNHTVFIDSYQETLVKRWNQQYWNVQLVLIEQ